MMNLIYRWMQSLTRAEREIMYLNTTNELLYLNTANKLGAEVERQRADNERMHAALKEIMLCNDDGYGPNGHCVNIAKRALAALAK
jgi:hypothetical protein